MKMEMLIGESLHRCSSTKQTTGFWHWISGSLVCKQKHPNGLDQERRVTTSALLCSTSPMRCDADALVRPS